MDVYSLSRQVRQLIIKQRFLTQLFVAGSIIISTNAWAEDNLSSLTGFPLIPGVTATGLAGPTVMGLFDAMVPLVGWPTSFLYVDPQFSIQNGDNYSGAGGAGYRWLSDQAGILGAYVFADYLHSPNNNNFWFVSPGIERLGDTIDFSANAYIPVSDQTQNVGVVQGTQIGQNQFVSFQGHNQFDALFFASESIGFGADAQIGYRLPIMYNPKVYVGGYYSGPQEIEDNIWGGAVRVEVPVTQNIRVSLSEAYDNFYHNTFKVGLSVDLVGRHTLKNYQENNLASRMLDPIQRNLILVAGGSVTNQPIIQNAAQFAESALVRSHISFFESVDTDPGSSQDGTFENPYQGLTQAHVNDGNSKGNNTFYFNTGTYIQNSQINFTNDDIYGRQTFNGVPFALPASGNSRPVFDFSGMSVSVPTAFNMTATQDIFVQDIVMKGNNSSTGILMTANNNSGINITFSDIEVDNFGVGIETDNLGTINTLLLDQVVASHNHGNAFELINQGNANNVTVQNSNLSNNSGTGVFVNNSSAILANLLISNTSLNQNINGFALINAAGTISGNLQITNSTMNNNTIDGVEIQNTSHGVMADIDISNSNINNNSRIGLMVNNETGTLGTVNILNTNINQNLLTGFNMDNTNGTMSGLLVDGSSVSMNHLSGLVVLNAGGMVTGNITLNNSSINNNINQGVDIENGVGGHMNDINVTGGTTINSNTDNGLLVNNTGTLADINIDASSLNTNTSDGLSVSNNVGGALSNINVSDSANLNQNGSSGIDIQNLGTLANFSVTDSFVNGNGTISPLGGILFNNGGGTVTGNITFSDAQINNNNGNGATINNLTGGTMQNVNVLNGTTLNDNTAAGLVITNSNLMQNITIDASNINSNTTDGLDVTNNLGATLNAITITNASSLNNNQSQGFAISNAGTLGAVVVNAGTSISQNGTSGLGVGMSITNSGTFTGDVTLDDATINNNSGVGFNVSNNSGTMQNINIVDGTTINGNQGSGFNIVNSAIVENINVISSHLNNNITDGIMIFNASATSTINTFNISNATLSNNDGNGVFVDNFRGTIAGMSVDTSNLNANGFDGLIFTNVGGTVTGGVDFINSTFDNNGSNSLLIANSVLGSMQNITVIGGTISNNSGIGLFIRNEGSDMNNVTVLNTVMNGNTANGLNFDNSLVGSVVNSITLDTITATGNTSPDVSISNTLGTITSPFNQVVLTPSSTLGSVPQCINCTFAP